MSISIREDCLNLVLYKHLLENGLPHTAFTLFAEAGLGSKLQLHEASIRAGHLLGLVERGLTLQHIERHLLAGQFIECKEPLDLLKPHICKETGRISQAEKDERRRGEVRALEEIRRSTGKYQAELSRLLEESRGLGEVGPSLDSFQAGLECLQLDRTIKWPDRRSICFSETHSRLFLYDNPNDRIIEYAYSPNSQPAFSLKSMIPCCLGNILWKADEIIVPNSSSPLIAFMENGEGFVKPLDVVKSELTTFSLEASLKGTVQNPFDSRVLGLIHALGAVIVDIERIQISNQFEGVIAMEWLNQSEVVLLRPDHLEYYSLASQSSRLRMLPPSGTKLSQLTLSRERFVVAGLASQSSQIFLWGLESSDHLLSVSFQSPVLHFSIMSQPEGAAFLIVMLHNKLMVYDYEMLSLHWELITDQELVSLASLEVEGAMVVLVATGRQTLLLAELGGRHRVQLPLPLGEEEEGHECWLLRSGRDKVFLVGQRRISLVTAKSLKAFLP